MSLIEKVIIKKPREFSGSIVQNAFDYQIKFSAYLALELISNHIIETWLSTRYSN